MGGRAGQAGSIFSVTSFFFFKNFLNFYKFWHSTVLYFTYFMFYFPRLLDLKKKKKKKKICGGNCWFTLCMNRKHRTGILTFFFPPFWPGLLPYIPAYRVSTVWPPPSAKTQLGSKVGIPSSSFASTYGIRGVESRCCVWRTGGKYMTCRWVYRVTYIQCK